MTLTKSFEAKEREQSLYRMWESGGVFEPNMERSKEPFTVIMPPPNANGKLHAGHAVGYTLEDVVVRYHRLKGHPTLWQPGTDHAGIETQFVYERMLKEKGLSRFDLGREKFYEEVKEFTLSSQGTILDQFRAMGFSADWSRLKFTLDEDVVERVVNTFIKMHDDDKVYRGQRIVNWCPRCEAAFADIEVEREDRTEPFYTFTYGPFEIATSRPETKFGDKYVVMHPDDERYADYSHGDTFTAEWINGSVEATVIKDDSIDMELGTGVMTITPWHDQTDYDIAAKNNLDKQQIIDEEGKLLPIAEEFAGMPILEARPLIVKKLEEKGLLVKTEPREHAVALHDRCGTLIEPQISLQWFVRMAELNRPVIKAFEEELTVFPKRFTKIATNWLENEHDWCISRGTWWGITIPVYYNKGGDDSLKDYIVAKDEQEAIDYYGAGNYSAETDTFDTWYSSGQWPYATLRDTVGDDFETFYPTTLMGTAKEILHKWVTRMVMFSLYVEDELPFKNIYLWGIVTDEKGQKMSKSKGNVLDPLVLSNEYGTDALRLTAALTNTPGNDSPLGENKVLPQRNFCNKLWNIAKFIEVKAPDEVEFELETVADHWIAHRFNERSAAVHHKIEQYRLNEAAYELYHFVWDDLADWYVEASKSSLNPGLLRELLRRTLALAHPFIPFITEEIWQEMFASEGEMLADDCKEYEKSPFKASLELSERFDRVIASTRAIRAYNKELGDVKGVSFKLNAEQSDADLASSLSRSEVTAGEGSSGDTAINSYTWAVIDAETAKALENKQQEKIIRLEQTISQLIGRLSNKGYVDNAPEHLVNETRAELEAAEKELEALKG